MADLSEAIQIILGRWRDEESLVEMAEDIQTIREQYVDLLQGTYRRAPESTRNNNLVPEHTNHIKRDEEAVKSKRLNDGYEVNYNWPEKGGFAEEPHETALHKGDMFDRIGDEEGRYVCRIMDGRRVSVDERSLPYYLIASSLTEEPAYHCYRVVLDFADLERAVEEYGKGPLRAIKRNYRKSKGKIWEGTVLASFGKRGGGNQLLLPLSVEELRKIKAIEELPKR